MITQKDGTVLYPCPIDLRQFPPYGTIPRSTKVDPIVDVELLDKEFAAGIDGEKLVSGWTAWQCPKTACPYGELSLLITDVSGSKDVIPVIAEPSTESMQFHAWARMTYSSAVELSSIADTFKRLDRCIAF